MRFLTKEAQRVRAQELSALPEGISGNPFSDTVEMRVASPRAEALLSSFLAQPSLQVLLDERAAVALAGWENAVGAKMAELRILRQLSSLLLVLAVGNMFLTATSSRKV